jgi:hypothetical protein
MLKIRNFSVFALAGVLGLAACGGEEAEAPAVEETNVDATAPVTDPAAAPVVVDPATTGMPADTGMGATGTTGTTGTTGAAGDTTTQPQP